MSVTQLVAGANCPVAHENLYVEIVLSPAQISDVEVDISAFALTANDKVRGDDDMIFYGQPCPGNGSVTLAANTAGYAAFSVDLPKLLESTHKVAFTATIHENRTNFDAFNYLQVTIKNTQRRIVLQATISTNSMVESALILGELYLRQGQWKFRAVGQGFVGGLKPLAEHFGVEISETKTQTPIAVSNNQLSNVKKKNVVLTKKEESGKISLAKKDGSYVIATANWLDNGDNSANNDDLDLRAGILLPNGKMKIIHCRNLGSLHQEPYTLHLGDVKSASEKKPGQEIIQVNPEIAMRYNGDIAIVFSVYSAISNGAVSIASLKPSMRLQYQNQIIDCKIDFSKDKKASQQNIYTYVIGTAIIKKNEIEISPGGLVSEPHSEATPWMIWDRNRKPKITMDGPVVTKDSSIFFAGMLNAGNKKKYD